MTRNRLHWATGLSCAVAACSLANAPADPDPPIACGDGVVEAAEACDDGNDSNTDDCLSTCVAASCGDGFVHSGVEACDDGNDSDTDDCPSTCVSPTCGDGFVQDGEACDDGNDATDDVCPSGPDGTCQMKRCGDGFVSNAPTVPDADFEACDDGNDTTHDDCPSGPEGTCRPAVCGDGFILEGVEACDDGNASISDECPSGQGGNCRLATCGDGFVFDGHEVCDDGNEQTNDDCPSGPGGSCFWASCGDGFVHALTEACDDGNQSNGDDCLSAPGGNCKLATCGDGWLNKFGQGLHETCEDFNASDVDFCSSICQCSFIQGWQVNGGWGIYAGPAPSIPEPVETPFPFPVFGTDGNRVKPYPGQEIEKSEAVTGSFVAGPTLTFESWHVDEGGNASNPYDRKAIDLSTDGGQTWIPFADCSNTSLAQFPFCVSIGAGRAMTAWDPVTLNTSNLVGQLVRLRFRYDSVDAGGGGFERGWYLRGLPMFTPCPPQ